MPLAAAVAALAAAAATAAPPGLVNARVEVRPGAGGLEQAVRAAGGGPAWIGYAVPGDGPHSMCCWDSVAGIGRAGRPGCRLEARKGAFTMDAAGGDGAVDLEGDLRMVVLLRVEGGRVGRVRALSWSCGVDAGGMPLTWLTDVRPQESAALLSSLVERGPSGRRGVLDGALHALALHAEPAALEGLMDLARRGAAREVRAQALFWLSQKAGRRAAGVIEEAAEEDPESEVRQGAVFALSQLPEGAGVPRLIALARSHRDPRVRRQAVFWLGQSEDARALAFFEEVLRP